MALIDELKERRDRQEEVLDQVAEAIKEREEYRLRVEQELDDLDIAIAALTPAPAPVEIEIPEGVPVIPTTEWTEPLSGLAPDLSSDDPDEQDDASEFAEPVPDPEFFVLDEQTCKPLDADLAQVLHDNMDQLLITDEAPALNEAMQDEREEGYAPVTNPEAHIQAVEAERFAQPTNPDADAIARAHDWYDPKAVAERNKFNPFSLFRAKEDA